MASTVPRRALRLATLALLGAAIVASAAPYGEARELTFVTTSDGGPVGTTISVVQGHHRRLLSRRGVLRFAVGDSSIAEVELVTADEILVLGKSPGGTTAIVWFADGSVEEMRLVVQRDLTVLREALQGIHPAIRVEAAPDRDAVILRGIVPSLTHSEAAVAAARSYLASGARAQAEGASVLVRAGSSAPAAPALPADELRVDSEGRGRGVAVINLLRLESLPARAEDRLRDEIAAIPGAEVRVRRILRGALPDDEEDTLLLEGTVRNQVDLVRILHTASRILTGSSPTGEDSIRVLADESGGLSGTEGANSEDNRLDLGGGGGSGFGGGRGANLGNLLEQNVGRAKALEAANGRVLSFVEVTDLPQVRVAIRLYEVNRSRLRSWSPELVAVGGDFQQGGLAPAGDATLVQGANAAEVDGAGGNAVQQVLSFLSGALGIQSQFVSGNFALDAALSLLESEGIARSLSAPSLTVLSGELAEFVAGGEVPIPTSFSSGLDADASGVIGVFNSVTFRSFGVQLGVRPLVGNDDTITLDLRPEVVTPDTVLTSTIRESTGTDPLTTAFSTRSLRTTTRLQDGQALLVAGLLSQNLSANESATPGLGDVPLLGSLFRSDDRSEDELELIVVVAPSLVRTALRDLGLWQFPTALELICPKCDRAE